MSEKVIFKVYNTNKHPITYAEDYVEINNKKARLNENENNNNNDNDKDNIDKKSILLINPQIIPNIEGREVVLNNKSGNIIKYRVQVSDGLAHPCSVGTPYDDISGLPSESGLDDIELIFGNFITAPEINRATGKHVIGPDTFANGIKEGNKLIGVKSFTMYPSFAFNDNKQSNWNDATIDDLNERNKYHVSSLVISAPNAVFYDDGDEKIIPLETLDGSYTFPKEKFVSLASSVPPKKEKLLLQVDNMSHLINVDVSVSGNYDTVNNIPPSSLSSTTTSSASPTYESSFIDKIIFVPESVALTIQKYRPYLLKIFCFISGNGNEGAVRGVLGPRKGAIIGYKSFKLWSDISDFPDIIFNLDDTK